MIVFVITENFPAINQTWIDTYLEGLIHNDIGIMIFTNNDNPSNYSNKVDNLKLLNNVVSIKLNNNRIISLFRSFVSHPCHTVNLFSSAFKFSRYLEKEYKLRLFPTLIKFMLSVGDQGKMKEVNIVHSHGEILAFEFMFYAIMFGKPLAYTFHGLPPAGVPHLPKNKRKALYGEAACVFVNTNFSKQQAVSIGAPINKIRILPQGLPLEDYKFSPRACPHGKEKLHILTVGRFHRDKGYGYSLIAAARLKRSGVNFHYDIVGVGPQKDWMLNIINKLQISDVVTIYEALPSDKLNRLYQEAHLFILPSVDNQHGEHVETQGVVLQEAQASGCIPIATSVGGIPECINHQIDGLIVKDRSHRAIADAVLYMLNNPDLWNGFQLSGRRNVEENFSADVIGSRMAAILNSMAQQ